MGVAASLNSKYVGNLNSLEFTWVCQNSHKTTKQEPHTQN